MVTGVLVRGGEGRAGVACASRLDLLADALAKARHAAGGVGVGPHESVAQALDGVPNVVPRARVSLGVPSSAAACGGAPTSGLRPDGVRRQLGRGVAIMGGGHGGGFPVLALGLRPLLLLRQFV